MCTTVDDRSIIEDNGKVLSGECPINEGLKFPWVVNSDVSGRVLGDLRSTASSHRRSSLLEQKDQLTLDQWLSALSERDACVRDS
eukprot:3213475-Pyramimonas_sp.AAC.1